MKRLLRVSSLVLILVVAVLFVAAPAAAAPTTYTWNGSLAIPDNNPSGVCATLNVPDSIVISDLNVTFNGNHAWVGDLSFRLISPANTQLTLMNRPGRTSSGFGNSSNLAAANTITFDDSASSSAETIGNGLSESASIPTGSFFPAPEGGAGSNLAQYNGTNAQGNWQFCIADEAGGDTGSMVTWALVIEADTTPPDTTLTVMPGDPHTSSDATFEFTSSEAGTFECSLESAAFVACTTPHNVSGLTDGSHTFQVRAIDAATNVDPTPASYAFTVALPDTTEPDTTLTVMPGDPHNSSDATFEFTSSEAGTFECSLDSAAFVACTTPHTVSGLTDGSHTFEVRAIDANSNVDATPASYTFTVDTTAPPTPPVVVTAEPTLPPPPPDDLLADSNFAGEGGVRGSVPDSLRAFINFRVIVENGSYVLWNNGQLTNAGTLGNQGVVDLGVLQAVNVYSPSGMQQFGEGVVVCLRGEGYMLWKPDGSVTNQYFWVETYAVEEFPGFSCITLFEAGILALVQNQPNVP